MQGRARDREPVEPRDGPFDARHALGVPHAVLRQPPTPAHDVGVHRLGGDARQLGQVRPHPCDEDVVGHLQRPGLSEPAHGPADQQRAALLAVVGPLPRRERECLGSEPAAVRAKLTLPDQHPRRGREFGPRRQRQRDHRHRGQFHLAVRGSGLGGDGGEQPARRGRRDRQHHRVGLQIRVERDMGLRGGAQPQPPPAAGTAVQLAHGLAEP